MGFFHGFINTCGWGDDRFYLGDHLRMSRATQLFWTVNEVVALLRASYCGTTTVEHEHVVSKPGKDWIRLMVERPQARSLFLPSVQRRILYHLLYAGWFLYLDINFVRHGVISYVSYFSVFFSIIVSRVILFQILVLRLFVTGCADHFERFLARKFQASKRFGIEGCESLIPGLFALIEVWHLRHI